MGYVCDVMTATNTYFSTGLISYNLWPFDSSCHSSLIIPNRLYTRLKKVENNNAGYLYSYGLGNVLGTKECHIV